MKTATVNVTRTLEARDLVERALFGKRAGLEEHLPAGPGHRWDAPALRRLDARQQAARVSVELRRDQPLQREEEARLVGGGGLRVGPPADTRRIGAHARFPRDACHRRAADEREHRRGGFVVGDVDHRIQQRGVLCSSRGDGRSASAGRPRASSP